MAASRGTAGLYGAGDQRVPPVGAHHHPGVLGDALAVATLAPDPGDASLLDQHLLHAELFPDLGAGLGRGVHSSLSSTVRRGRRRRGPPRSLEIPRS
jgi:hypothetical protein